ncbi:hypothetical protein CC80DRAFT_501273 [Byssothecium circinans]|uniref:Uncharacterized protein n=1 Tax=Byssothecium circinans TaxID=147558 RepID=A0A6A5U7B4_9PLEO|nr:hypothetical protein CC80DRAFT_501273 [Byssothecium circinans]
MLSSVKSILYFAALSALTAATALRSVDSPQVIPRDLLNQIENLLQARTPEELMNLLSASKRKVARGGVPDLSSLLPSSDANTATLVATFITNLNVEQLISLLHGCDPTGVAELVGNIQAIISPERAASTKREALDLSGVAALLPKETAPTVLEITLKSLRGDRLKMLVNKIKIDPQSTIDRFLKLSLARSRRPRLPISRRLPVRILELENIREH